MRLSTHNTRNFLCGCLRLTKCELFRNRFSGVAIIQFARHEKGSLLNENRCNSLYIIRITMQINLFNVRLNRIMFYIKLISRKEVFRSLRN